MLGELLQPMHLLLILVIALLLFGVLLLVWVAKIIRNRVRPPVC
ncbi:MAG: hypothetical protein Q7I92_04165 [Humidesulfovibrio sp.]|nr:hypothetical protein [Humidesulfovibrio sp.]